MARQIAECLRNRGMPPRPDNRVAENGIVAATPVSNVKAQQAAAAGIVARESYNLVFAWVVRQQQQFVRLRQCWYEGARIVIACVIGADDFEQAPPRLVIAPCQGGRRCGFNPTWVWLGDLR